jgi:small neutral amino acid transporter SnatA (MarC family)
MSSVLLFLAALGTVNPPRARLGLPETGEGRARIQPAALGAVVAVLAVWAIAAVSGPFLEAIDVSAETFVIAAGLVIGLAGLRSIVRTAPAPEPELDGAMAALWPVAFPRLVAPETVALAIAAGARNGVAPTIASIGVAMALVVVLAVVPRRAVGDGALRWLGAVAGVVLVLVGTVLMIEGVRLV